MKLTDSRSSGYLFLTLDKGYFIVEAGGLPDRNIQEPLRPNVGCQGLGICHALPFIMLAHILGLLTGNDLAKLVDLFFQDTWFAQVLLGKGSIDKRSQFFPKVMVGR